MGHRLGVLVLVCVSGCLSAPAEITATDMLSVLGYVRPDEAPGGACGVLVPLAEGRSQPAWWIAGVGDAPVVVGPDGTARSAPRVAEEDTVLRARPMPDGGVVVLDGHGRVIRRDAQGRRRWAQSLNAHHDLRVASDGTVRVLTLATTRLPGPGGRLRVPDDRVTVLGPEGHPQGGYSLSEVFADAVPPDRWAQARAFAWNGSLAKDADPGDRDLLHSNGIDIVHTARGACAVGDDLVLLRNLSMLACLSPQGEEHWRWEGSDPSIGVLGPHDPRQLADGRIALFDNGPGRGWSRILVVDPASGRHETVYGGPSAGLYSEVMGESMPLEDGSWLINASTARELWRVSPSGEVWWRWRACADLGPGWIHHVQPAEGLLSPPASEASAPPG